MNEPDHYRVLGVRRFASPQSVRHAYVALMKQHHPDAGSSAIADDAAGRIARAYWELRHPDRRAAYDARLRAESRRKARRHAVTLQLTGPPARHPRRGTRLLFALSVAGAAALVGWTLHQQPQRPGAPASRADTEITNSPAIDGRVVGDERTAPIIDPG